MTLLEWTPQLEIDLAMIDDQHRNLVGLLNETYRIAITGDTGQALADVFEELELYTLNHFREEEALMRRLDYEFLAVHQEEHRQLAAQVVAYRDAYESGEGDILGLLEFMKAWLITHLAGADRHIGDFMRQRGLAG